MNRPSRHAPRWAIAVLAGLASLGLAWAAWALERAPDDTAGGLAASPPGAAANGELLVSGLPEGWRAVHHSAFENLKITEFAPPEDAGLDELIRVELAALGGETDPLRFLDARQEDLEHACLDSRASHVWSGYENGNATALRLFICPHNRETRRGHVTLMKVINGAEGVYVIARTRLTEPFPREPADGALPVSQHDIGAWAAWMRQVRVLPPKD